jgi:hypothetical protein
MRHFRIVFVRFGCLTLNVIGLLIFTSLLWAILQSCRQSKFIVNSRVVFKTIFICSNRNVLES